MKPLDSDEQNDEYVSDDGPVAAKKSDDTESVEDD